MKTQNKTSPHWIEANLRLTGIDSRMVALLQGIAECGSISQAAKQCGLSYKGAWMIIERANNSATKTLVSTATGGSKGGGACLTESGRALLALFSKLEFQHNQFLEGLNRELSQNPDACLLLQHLAVKTSARNQLFGKVSAITNGAVNAHIRVELTAGVSVIVAIGLQPLNDLGLTIGKDAVLLINSADIILSLDDSGFSFPAANRLTGTIIRIQHDDINAEASILLPGGELLACVITVQSLKNMALEVGTTVQAIFKANAPILGVL